MKALGIIIFIATFSTSSWGKTLSAKVGYLNTSKKDSSFNHKDVKGVRLEGIYPYRVDESIKTTTSFFSEFESGSEVSGNAWGILEKVGFEFRISNDVQLYTFTGFALGYYYSKYPFVEKGIDTTERASSIFADIHFGFETQIEQKFGFGLSYSTREAIAAEKVSRLGQEVDSEIKSSSRLSLDMIYYF